MAPKTPKKTPKTSARKSDATRSADAWSPAKQRAVEAKRLAALRASAAARRAAREASRVAEPAQPQRDTRRGCADAATRPSAPDGSATARSTVSATPGHGHRESPAVPPPYQSGSPGAGLQPRSRLSSRPENSSLPKVVKPRLRNRMRGMGRMGMLLKDAIIRAADLEGGGNGADHDGLIRWLRKQARTHPVAFMGLLAKVIPLQIQAHSLQAISVEIVKRDTQQSTGR